jgi:hypothetical protein
MDAKVWPYLYDGVAEDRCSDVADPHTSKHGDEHIGEENCPRLRSRLTQDKGCHDLGDVILG